MLQSAAQAPSSESSGSQSGTIPVAVAESVLSATSSHASAIVPETQRQGPSQVIWGDVDIMGSHSSRSYSTDEVPQERARAAVLERRGLSDSIMFLDSSDSSRSSESRHNPRSPDVSAEVRRYHEFGISTASLGADLADMQGGLSSRAGIDAAQNPCGPAWSEGAAKHGTGSCRPCAWNWKPSGCHKGSSCEFCHMCEENALRERKQERLKILKDAKKAARRDRKNIVVKGQVLPAGPVVRPDTAGAILGSQVIPSVTLSGDAGGATDSRSQSVGVHRDPDQNRLSL